MVVNSYYRNHPDVAYNPFRNTYLVTYSLEDTGASKINIVSRTASFDLLSIGPEFELVSGNQTCIDPAVASRPDEYLVAWSSLDSVYGSLVGGDGIPISPTGGLLLNFDPPKEYHRTPDVGYLSGSMHLATWHYFDGFTVEGDVYAQFIQARTTSFK